MPLFDFRCEAGHVFERRLEGHTCCPPSCACGKPSTRLWTGAPAVVGPTTDTRGLYRRFTEASAEIDHAASRIEANTGQAVSTPNLWQQAKERATAMSAAGENPYPTQKST